MNKNLIELQEENIVRFRSYFLDVLLPKFETINQHRKQIVPVIKARNMLVLSGSILFFALFILLELGENLPYVMSGLIWLYSGPYGLLFSLLTFCGFVLWAIKAYYWVQQVRTGRELVSEYQDIYSRFVFESISEFLEIDLSFSSVGIEDRKNNLTLATKQAQDTERLIRNDMNQSLLFNYDTVQGFTSTTSEKKSTWKKLNTNYSGGRIITIDDHVSGKHSDFSFKLTESKISEKQGKQTVEVFKGVFISVELPTTLRDKTFVLTKGDTRKVKGQGNWFGNLFKKKTLDQTTLEWNDFNNDLKVITGDEQEARYILTPDFMLTLHEWWKLKGQKIRTSFVGNKMHVMVPIDKVVIGLGRNHENFHTHFEYIESLMLSIWYTQILLDRLPRQLALHIDQNKIR